MDEKDENILENQVSEEKKDITMNETPVEAEVLEEDKPGLSIAAMILGIVSLVFWCYWPISIICGILALIFGIIRMKKPAGKGMAIAGFVTGLIAIVCWGAIFGITILGVAAYNLAI